MDHVIKLDPIYYNDIVCGRKRFEVRYNDRNYQVGDYVRFYLWPVPASGELLSASYRITYVLKSNAHDDTRTYDLGIMPDYVVFGFERVGGA